MTLKPQSAVFAEFNAPDPCPIAPDGTPRPDPEATWQQEVRERWLAPRPRPPDAPPRKAKDPIFSARLQSLEQLLRMGQAGAEQELIVEPQGGTSTESGAAGGGSEKPSKAKEPSVEDIEPDGGMVIRQKAGDELKRASEVRSPHFRLQDDLLSYPVPTEHSTGVQAVETAERSASAVVGRQFCRPSALLPESCADLSLLRHLYFIAHGAH